MAYRVIGQPTPPPAQELPKDPQAIYAAVAPLYDFSVPPLKPWHLKATYQIYDEHGKPSEQGTYERWWASSKVYRDTWSRPNATLSDWYTADGNHLSLVKGERLNYFESALPSSLFSPLSDLSALEPEKSHLTRKDASAGGVKFPCISMAPAPNSPLHFPSLTYCLDPNHLVLRTIVSSDQIAAQFNNIVKIQGRYLAREISISLTGQKLFTVMVTDMNGMDASDPMLVPPPNATQMGSASFTHTAMEVPDVKEGSLINKQQPIYPIEAKQQHEAGIVLLQVFIGKDGKVHDLRVLASPADPLAAAAKEAVSHWEYKPYLLNGEPVEVDTLINVIFTLGG